MLLPEVLRNIRSLIEDRLGELPLTEDAVHKRNCLRDADMLLDRAIRSWNDPSSDRQRIYTDVARALILAGEGGVWN